MALSDLIAARTMGAVNPHPASPADEPAAPGKGGSGAEDNSQKGDKPSVEEPYGVAQVVTPSGLEIYYQAGPKRLYRVRHARVQGPMGWKSDDLCEWYEVPSVSEALSVLEKGGLSWWGQGVGAEGVLSLIESGELTWVE